MAGLWLVNGLVPGWSTAVPPSVSGRYLVLSGWAIDGLSSVTSWSSCWSMVFLWFVYGLVGLWFVPGWSMVCPWLVYGLVGLWFGSGWSKVWPWLVYGFALVG